MIFSFAGKVLEFYENSFDCTENHPSMFLKYSAQTIVQKKVPASILKMSPMKFAKK